LGSKQSTAATKLNVGCYQERPCTCQPTIGSSADQAAVNSQQ